jgi:hypothetical protein
MANMKTVATTVRSRRLSICNKTLCILLGSLLTLAFTLPLRAQMATADVLGTVIDGTGAVVPGAKVTIRNTGTDIASTEVTSNTGEFLFSKLQIGNYNLTVEAKGFKSFAVAGLTLAVGDRIRLDARLEVGSQVETVEVAASAAVELQKDTSEVSSLIPAESVSEMPTNGRNYYNLMQLEPGIVSSSGPGDPTDARPVMAFGANGMASQFNNNLIDGLDNNERSLGEVAVEPSLDALEEVKVETNTYSAEYGRTGGGIANLITKSGTNQFHGTLFEFMRNDDLDAYPWTLSAKLKTELRQNQFGGSFGGPILKNKAFFFGDYQGWRQIKGALSQQLVANQAEYTSIHSGGDITLADAWDYWQQNGLTEPNGGTGITIPKASINSLGLAYLMEAPAPLPNCDPTCPNVNFNWQGSANRIQNADTYDGRVDYQINDRDRLFGRYSYNNTGTTTNGGQSTPGGFPATTIVAGDSHLYYPGTNVQSDVMANLALDYVHIFSAKTLFEAKASYLRSRLGTRAPYNNDYYFTLAQLGLPCNQYYCYSSSVGDVGLPLPQFSGASSGSKFAGAIAPYGRGYSGEGGILGYIENTFQYNASLTLNRGAHSIKIGATLIRRQDNSPTSSIAFLNFAPEETGNVLGDTLEGDVVSYNNRASMINPMPHYRMWEPSAYIQDDWRATRSLTLNLGVRYDIYSAWTERNGYLANFDLNTDLIVSPNLLGDFKSSPTGNVKTDFGDVSPRIGFAYSINNNNIVLKNMVLRGGWGISYFPANIGQGFFLLNTPFLQGVSCGNPMYAFGSASCNSANGWIPDSVYASEPYGLPDGGYNLQYGLPMPVFATSVTQAETPSEYNSTVSGSSFLPYDFKPAYQEEFSLQLQKQVANNILTAGFVGNQGRRIPTGQNINQPISATAPFPMYSSATPWMNNVSLTENLASATSLWLAGEATYARKLSHGLSANINYTWSRWSGQDTGGTDCVLDGCPMDAGNGSTVPVQGWQQYNYDGYTTHRAAGMVTYNIPYGQHLNRVLGAAAKGWTLNGTGYWQTGAWNEIKSNVSYSGINARGLNDFPNRVPGVSLKPAHRTLQEWFNISAFEHQASGTLGNAKGNQVEGPRTRDADLSLGKIFSLYENLKLQFRAECFNFTNTPNYASAAGGGPGPGGGGNAAAYTISSYDSNGIATAANGFGSFTIVSNDPRIFQFGLKLIY